MLLVGIVAFTCTPLLPHPQLEPDDYRYLQQVDGIRGGRSDLAAAFVVENRWDHLWFVDLDAVVRFFRPTVILGFLLDSAGGPDAGALLRTNILLHLGCALLVMLLLLRWFGRGLPACLGSAAFAVLACHAETIWYVSGRTDTLAALGFLGALWLHGADRGWLRWLALPAYAFALLSKELTMALPLLALLHDWLLLRRGTIRQLLRSDWPRYLGYAAVLVAYLLLRAAMLGGTSTPLTAPYFVAPLSAAFLPHLGAQLLAYAADLVVGTAVPPFLQAADLGIHFDLLDLLAPPLILLLLLYMLRSDRRRWFFVLLALGTWLPTCFVYVSERYLYLPSFAFAGALALLASRSPPASRQRIVGAASLCIWMAFQGSLLHRAHDFVAQRPRDAWSVDYQVDKLVPPLPRGAHVLFVNFPGDVVHAQFVQDQLRVRMSDPDLQCHVLTLAPPCDTGAISLRAVDAHTLEVRAATTLMRQGGIFPMVPFVTGARIDKPRSGCAAIDLIDGDGSTLRGVRFHLQDALADCVVLRFVPPAPWPAFVPNSARILDGTFVVEHP